MLEQKEVEATSLLETLEILDAMLTLKRSLQSKNMYWEQGTIFNSSSTQFQMMDIKLKEWDLILTQSLGRLELMSIDRRDESNVDEFYKLGSLTDIRDMGLEPSFVVTGNTPAVLRESLLPQAFKLGEGAVAASMELEGAGKGMVGSR